MKRTILLLSTLFLLEALFVYFVLVQQFPHSGDDHAYLYQARLFASGRLYAQDPLYDLSNPLNRYVAAKCLTDFNGRRFAKYAPGWPVLLSAGVAAGAEWMVNPLLGALLVGLMLAYVRRRMGSDWVRPTWMLLASCAFFVFNFALFRSHAATMVLIFAAFYVYTISEERQDSSGRLLFLAGALLGFSALVRYVDWLPLGMWIAGRSWRRKRIRELMLFGIGFGMFAWGNLLFNDWLSGNPLATPAALYGAGGLQDRLALSWRGFPVTGARLGKLLYCFPPVLLLILFWKRLPQSARRDGYLAMFLMQVGLYFFYPAAIGGPGARYLLAYFPFVVLAVVDLARHAGATPGFRRVWTSLAAAQVVCSLIYTGIESNAIYQRRDVERTVQRLNEEKGGGKKIVLLRSDVYGMNLGDLLRNPPELDSATTLFFAWDDGARLNELLARFPGRDVFVYEYPGVAASYSPERHSRMSDGPRQPRLMSP